MKKWVSGEFKNARELIEALVGEGNVYRSNLKAARLSKEGYISTGAALILPHYAVASEYGYMKEIPWYESIPEHGRLCWYKGFQPVVLIKSVDSDKTHGFSFDVVPYALEALLPLTNEEIKQFLIEE